MKKFKKIGLVTLKYLGFSALVFLLYIGLVKLLVKFLVSRNPNSLNLEGALDVFYSILIYLFLLVILCVISIVKSKKDFVKKMAWSITLLISLLILFFLL